MQKKPSPKVFELPQKGLPYEQIFSELQVRSSHDVNPSEGRTWAYVYEVDKKHTDFVNHCFSLFLNKNGLNPLKFVSLRNIEIELIEIAKKLWHAQEDAVGNFTSGGTESLILAVKAYRDFARTRLPKDQKPDVLVCSTGHPAIQKAA